MVAFGPGRVNLIGEHTDYNGGLALPFAISDGVTVRARRRPGERISVWARDFDEHDEFDLVQPGPAESWCAFVRGAAGELARAGFSLTGGELEAVPLSQI